eukprot:1024737-Prymnesium_polylepis.1
MRCGGGSRERCWRASAAGRAGVPSGVHPRHLPEDPRGGRPPYVSWMISRTSTAQGDASIEYYS